jgi:hypothetical protein
MKKYHVQVSVRILKIYEVQAENPQAASEYWEEGELICIDDVAPHGVVISVKEQQP